MIGLNFLGIEKILIQVPSRPGRHNLKLQKKYDRSSLDSWIVNEGLNLCTENDAHFINGLI